MRGNRHNNHNHKDVVAAVKHTPNDGKKNRLWKQSCHQKEGSHEEGKIILKEDFVAGSMEVEKTSLGVGNGHNNHKQWFNEALPPKSTHSRAKQCTS